MKYTRSWSDPHTHLWIDPEEPLQRTTYLPVIGEGPRQMHAGHVYRCRECGQEVDIPIRFQPPPPRKRR